MAFKLDSLCGHSAYGFWGILKGLSIIKEGQTDTTRSQFSLIRLAKIAKPHHNHSVAIDLSLSLSIYFSKLFDRSCRHRGLSAK